MHSWELAELAAHLANCGQQLSDTKRPVSSAALGKYWVVSKCRIDCWNRALKQCRQAPPRGKVNRSSQRLYSICREILISEVLSRVWASVASAVDVANGRNEAEPLATSVLNAHLDSTNRVLNLLSAGFTPLSNYRPELNRFRRQAERWTDLLLGRLGWKAGIEQYAHDSARAADFADDFSQTRHEANAAAEWRLLLASFRATFRQNRPAFSANGDLNSRIASGILACLPEEIFDHTDGFDWLWQWRLTSAANETALLVDQLLETGEPQDAAPLGLQPISQLI
jgi:hypothetical protein